MRLTEVVRSGLAALVLAAAVPGAARADGPAVDVQLDKARILRMPAHAATIVVGNPIIADVTTLKTDGLVVVTGKGFGETNLIFLDSAGTAVQETNVRVSAANAGMTVQRGMDRETYSCMPRCQPTVSLGDADPYLRGASGQISTRNGLAQPAQH